ncbi:MAG: hypothetical protein EOO51_11200 [Flavobacterium sp.]|nr:MAG: hypothetical protein EOO51_11200 [Flavobacterium sp.]
MFRKFLGLERRAFFRSASFSVNLALKILMGFVAIYFTVCFLALGIGAFFIIRESTTTDPLEFVNRYLIYYFIIDLIIRLLLQKIPVMNIRPLLAMPIRKNTIVNFALAKTAASFFNFLHWFFFIPFAIVLMTQGYDKTGAVLWLVAMMCLIYSNNFLNILINNKDWLFYLFAAVVLSLAALQYYGIFDVTSVTVGFFQGMYATLYLFAIPLAAVIVLYFLNFNYLKSNLHLDTGLSKKHAVANTEHYGWLDQFGTVGTFLKNDIRLIKRNKRSRMTVVMSVFFLFYGLLFFTNSLEAYRNPMWHMFAGIFVTGGFLFTFGQFVPSWDSSYYNLMMTQNISYKGYLRAKWWLIVVGTLISLILASGYLYFGWHVYLMIVVGAIYNMGFNSHLVLLGGAFNKTAIDLNAKTAFGEKKAFNLKTMLVSMPKLVLPILLYFAGKVFFNDEVGLAFVAVAGIIGFALRDRVFSWIEKIYRTEKYSTIQAYKQNNN